MLYLPFMTQKGCGQFNDGLHPSMNPLRHYKTFLNPNSLGCVQNRIQIGGFGTVRVLILKSNDNWHSKNNITKYQWNHNQFAIISSVSLLGYSIFLGVYLWTYLLWSVKMIRKSIHRGIQKYHQMKETGPDNYTSERQPFMIYRPSNEIYFCHVFVYWYFGKLPNVSGAFTKQNNIRVPLFYEKNLNWVYSVSM